MIQVNMPAALRTGFGKGESRRLRMNEMTPAVLYSRGSDAIALQFEAAMLYKNLFDIHGRNAVVSLSIDGDEKGERHVLVKEIQKNPVTERLVHVDFVEIALDKPVVFTVPLKYTGVAKGVDLGGELHTMKTNVKLRGCPLDFPDFIEINISHLNKGDKIKVDDLAVPEKVEMLDSGKSVCVMVS